MDPSYDPLRNFNPFHAKFNFVMNNFDELNISLKEKKTRLEEIHGRQIEKKNIQ